MQRFAGARVFVTGATGFIGSAVTRKLVAEGASVTALVRDTSRTDSLKALGVRLVQGNLRDAATLDFSGQDLVIHSAAWVGFGIPKKKRATFRETNVKGTANVIEAARRADVTKLVHVSSVAAIGRVAEGKSATEADVARHGHDYASLYEETKTISHRAVEESGLHVALPMPGLVIGRGSDFDGILKRFAAGKLAAIPKDDGTKGWVHVDDAAEGILLAALRGSGPYVLVDDNVTAGELFARLVHLAGVPKPKRRISAKWIARGAAAVESSYHLLGQTPPLSREIARGLIEPARYDSTRARRELAWSPDLWTKLTADVRALKPPPKLTRKEKRVAKEAAEAAAKAAKKAAKAARKRGAKN